MVKLAVYLNLSRLVIGASMENQRDLHSGFTGISYKSQINVIKQSYLK